jgi:hypothetical protein
MCAGHPLLGQLGHQGLWSSKADLITCTTGILLQDASQQPGPPLLMHWAWIVLLSLSFSLAMEAQW